jgi:hypothetical protein
VREWKNAILTQYGSVSEWCESISKGRIDSLSEEDNICKSSFGRHNELIG